MHIVSVHMHHIATIAFSIATHHLQRRKIHTLIYIAFRKLLPHHILPATIMCANLLTDALFLSVKT